MADNSKPSVFTNDNKSLNQDQKGALNTSLNFGKMFLFMFIGLLITSIVCLGFGYLLEFGYLNNYGVGLLIGIIIAAFAMMICTILASVLARSKNRRSMSVSIPFFIYSVAIGYLLSFLMIAIPIEVVTYTLGITVAIFLVLSLLGFFMKSSVRPLMYVISALSIGALLLVIINLCFVFLYPGFETIYWVVSFIMFAILMLVTIVDIYNIKKIAESGSLTNNLALYCAFILYCDFIALFIRILYYMLIIFSKRK